MTEKPELSEIQFKFRHAVNLVHKFIGANAPKTVIAFAIVRLLIPRIIAITNTVNECSKELGAMFAESIAVRTNVCMICRKVQATHRIESNQLCLKCAEELKATLDVSDDVNGTDKCIIETMV